MKYRLNLCQTELRSRQKELTVDQKIDSAQVINEIIPFLKEHPEITCLILRRNNVNFIGTMALVATGAIPHINEIDLGYNPLGDNGAMPFSHPYNTITKLNLEGTGITDKTVFALCSNTKLVVNYDVIGNPITDQGMLAIGERNPIARANNGKNVLPTVAARQPEVPSLGRICFYQLPTPIQNQLEPDIIKKFRSGSR